MTSPGFDVFLSHSSRNAELASAMKQYLSEQGIRCWKAPDDISPAEDWPSAIMHALGECPIVVLVWTKDAMESRQVCREVTIADNRTKAIIPFRAEEILPVGPLEFFLVNKQWLDAFHDYQPAFESLSKTILTILGRAANAPDISPPLAGSTPAIESIPLTSPAPTTADADEAVELAADSVSADDTTGPGTTPAGDSELNASERRLLEALAQFEAFAGDAELRERLGWKEKTLERTKDSLVSRGLILAGTGRGGTSALHTPKLLQLSAELADESLPGCIFVNIGEAKAEGNTTRDWNLCAEFGFVSAGHGSRYANDMKRIRPGAIIYAYSSGAGYVGVGTALEPAVPMAQFLVDGVPLQEKVPPNPLFFHHLDDLEMCEWAVKVKWDKTFGREEAIYRSGLFVYVATSCRIKDAITVQYLRQKFNSFLDEAILTDDDLVS
jgi:hypothetical protein